MPCIYINITRYICTSITLFHFVVLNHKSRRYHLLRKPLRSKEKNKTNLQSTSCNRLGEKSHLETLQTLIIVKSLNSPWFMDVFFKKKVQVNWLSGAFRHVKLDCLFYKIFILLTYNDKLATTVFCASINNLYLKALVMVN